MTKKIIVLIDLTPFSKRLLVAANSWAIRLKADLLVVHQTFSAAPGMGDPEIKSQIGLQSRREALARVAAFVAETKISEANIKFHVTTSNLDTALLKLKTRITADIIVVGLKSKNWMERIFLGDTAIKLVNELSNTIIAIPDIADSYDLSMLHVAISPRYPLNEQAFTHLISTNGGERLPVKLISVTKQSEQEDNVRVYLQSLCDKYATMADINYEIIQSEDPYSALKHYMEEREGLLMIQKGTRNLADIFRKYFVNDVISHGQFPVVILPLNDGQSKL